MDSTSTSSATSTNQTKPLIVIVGETGSGKSALAMQIARLYDGEIIAADSRTIYKYMDIGTAKPSQQEQAEIPHHLLDIVEPDQRFTAAQFKQLAVKAIADIRSRAKLPIIVGGTGLYVDSVIFDFQFASDPDPAIRHKLNALSLEQLAEMVREAGGVDVNLKNRRHMVRYLETGGTPKQEMKLIDNTYVIGVQRSRSELRKRIEQRVEMMFRAGLRKEIDSLVARYGWDNEAMSGIIYRLFKSYEAGEISMSEVKRQFVKKDLLLAKRQRTWFKRNPHIAWFSDEDKAIKYIKIVVQNTT